MKIKKLLIAAAMVVGAFTASRVSAAYVQSLLNDGTNQWYMASVSNQLTFQSNAGAAVLTIDATNGPILPAAVTVAALPTCNAAIKGALRIVSDATTPTYNGALTGGSTVIVPVFCTGAAWVSH